MELRGQDTEIGMPSRLSCSPPTRDPSWKLPTAPIISISPLGDRRRDRQAGTPQPSDHHPFYHRQQLNPQHQSHKPTRDPGLTHLAPAPMTVTSSTSPAPTHSRSPPPSTTNPISTSSSPVSYRECLKNHAASMGGHVVDGCGEFMPSGEEGTTEAFRCAACECHRNFHRKETDGEPQYFANCYYKDNSHRNTLPPPQQLATSLPPSRPPFHQHHRLPHGHGLSMSVSTPPTAPMMMAFGGGGVGAGAAAESSSEDLTMFQSNLQGQAPLLSKKRFRTKFSQEQKEKMMEFAEKIEWKIQKQEEQEVQQFCSQVGVKRKVFKVWMHNNKQAMKKKQT